MSPPRLPALLVRAAVERCERRFVLADLHEEYDAVVASRGRAAARRWYWGQALRSLGPSIGRRLFRRRRGALRRPGGRRGGIFRDIVQDVEYGLRGFVRAPGFTVVAVLTLTLGIGASTAIYTVVNAVLYRPLPFAEPEKLVTLWETKLDGGPAPSRVSPPNFLDWREQNDAFSGVAALSQGGFVLTGDGVAERVAGMVVSAGFFPLLGVRVELGRGFVPEDESGANGPVVIVSHGFWTSRFAADPAAVGNSVLLDDIEHLVVGVLPADFQFIEHADLWTPMAFPPEARRDAMRGARYLEVMARLAPGVSLAAAGERMDALARRLEAHPNNAGWGISLQPLHEHVVEGFRSALHLILASVGCVMVIACANVANLVVARSAKRSRESALRSALGASRLRLFRQAFTENTLLALGGGALGVVIAHWTIVPLVRLAPTALPRLDGVGVDASVLAFAVGVSLFSGLLFSLLTVFFGSGADSSAFLRTTGVGDGRGRWRIRNVLIVSEVALSLVLLAGAGLMTRSFMQMRHVDPGFVFEDIVTASVFLPSYRYGAPEQKAAFYRDLLTGLASLDGVRSVGATTNLPMSGSGMTFGFRIRWTSDERRTANFRRVSCGECRLLPDDGDSVHQWAEVQRCRECRGGRRGHRQPNFGAAPFRGG
ncbi:MAG: ABC transporter permease [Gemmatimonadetes bacterium]|nr:ABC transporter permease [Gemmatimonadota bacterium]